MSELLLDLELGKEQREYARNIQRSATALLTVINDILDFSKVESGHLDIEEVQFSLPIVVQEASKMLGFAAAQKALDFQNVIGAEISEDLVVMGDPGRVRQIILNVLTNSIKFTNQGYVKFSVTKENETPDTMEVKFVVEDSGIGIEDDIQKRLFQPFSQGDPSTARRFGGTGLGLTICKHLLELMRGRITLESQLGCGTVASFWIPFSKPQGPRAGPIPPDSLPPRLQSDMSLSCNSSDPGVASAILASIDGPVDQGAELPPSQTVGTLGTSDSDDLPASERAKIHVLVVEDNRINQQIATKTIQKLGFTVDAVWNGKEALEYLSLAQGGKKNKPNIILMDVQMPVIDGYKCTHLVRHHLPYRTYVQDVPIVAMTASAIQGDQEKCKKAGMDDYLSKPVQSKTLEKMLVRWSLQHGRRRRRASTGAGPRGNGCNSGGRSRRSFSTTTTASECSANEMGENCTRAAEISPPLTLAGIGGISGTKSKTVATSIFPTAHSIEDVEMTDFLASGLRLDREIVDSPLVPERKTVEFSPGEAAVGSSHVNTQCPNFSGKQSSPCAHVLVGSVCGCCNCCKECRWR